MDAAETTFYYILVYLASLLQFYTALDYQIVYTQGKKKYAHARTQANTPTHRYFKIAPQDPAASLFDFFGSKEFLMVPACMMRIAQCLARVRVQLSTERAWLWSNMLYNAHYKHLLGILYKLTVLHSGTFATSSSAATAQTHKPRTQVRTHVRMMCYTKGLQQTNASLSQQCDILQFRSVLSLALPGYLRTRTSKSKR